MATETNDNTYEIDVQSGETVTLQTANTYVDRNITFNVTVADNNDASISWIDF